MGGGFVLTVILPVLVVIIVPGKQVAVTLWARATCDSRAREQIVFTPLYYVIGND